MAHRLEEAKLSLEATEAAALKDEDLLQLLTTGDKVAPKLRLIKGGENELS